MDNETLDRLMIDCALGALTPEVEVLLGDYFARDSDAHKQFMATREAVRMSRDLLRTEDVIGTLPFFGASNLMRVRRRHRMVLQGVGLAAALMTCFFMGRNFSERDRPERRPSIVSHVTAEPPASSPGMWSIASVQSPLKPIRTTHWKWTSPTRQPERITQGELR
jgi:hypothetical protein